MAIVSAVASERQDRLQRIARRQIDQREADDADAERDRDRVKQPAEDVVDHGCTTIGVRSWNQFCACTKPVQLRRQRARVEIVHDPDHQRAVVLQLVQFGQQRQALVGVELVQDLADEILDLRIVEVAPVAARRRPVRSSTPA